MRNEAGFTLLEVLVAFIIAALAMGVLFQGASAGLRSVRVAGHYEEAISRVRSRLASIGVDGSLSPGEQAGDDGGGFSWRSRVTQLASTPLGDSGQQAVRAVLYAVEVSVGWDLDGGHRQVLLRSERLGAFVPKAP